MEVVLSGLGVIGGWFAGAIFRSVKRTQAGKDKTGSLVSRK